MLARAAGKIAEVDGEGAVCKVASVLAVDGVVGVEELVGDVGEDGGAARGDAAFGDEDEEAGEEKFYIEGGIEFGELGEEIGGEVFGVVVGVSGKRNGGDVLGVAEAEAMVRAQAGEAATLAVGIDVGAA